MDKLTCNIVRDLMPLVLDDIASADSKQGVEEHIENCETCRAYFEGMSMQISRAGEPVSDKGFKQFVRDLKRKNKIKKILLACLAVFMVGVIGIVGIVYTNGLRTTYENMPIEFITAQMYLDSGDVVMLDMQTHGNHEFYWYMEDIQDCGDDEIIVYLTPVEPKLRWGNPGSEHVRARMDSFVWEGDQLYYHQEVWNGYSERSEYVDFKVLSLRWGTAEENVELYNEGDIPADSPDEELNQ